MTSDSNVLEQPMGVGHAGIRVGRVEVTTLCQGWAPIALADELPDRSVDWAAERGRRPWAFHGEDAWPWHVHAFAVRSVAGIVLVDSGLGSFPPYRPWIEHVDPDEALSSAGVDPALVRHVVMTHLHADHAGGAMKDDEPRFPNAVYHVHPADWSFFEPLDDEDEYVARHSMQRLADLGMLDLGPEDEEVLPGIRVEHSPGHTPGHRSVLVSDDRETLLLTGDLLHLPVQAAHPDWPSSHDVEPELGSRSRRSLLTRAREDGWALGVSHFALPFGRIGPDGWR